LVEVFIFIYVIHFDIFLYRIFTAKNTNWGWMWKTNHASIKTGLPPSKKIDTQIKCKTETQPIIKICKQPVKNLLFSVCSSYKILNNAMLITLFNISH